MNNIYNTQAERIYLRKKFKGKTRIKSKIQTHYKKNLEREYRRIIDGYYAFLGEAIQTILKALLYGPTGVQAPQSGFRTDNDNQDFINFIHHIFMKAGVQFRKNADKYDLGKKIEKLGKLTERLSESEWKRVVSKTLGIDILDDYYSGEFYREQLKRWTDDNANLISTLPDEALGEMRDLVEESFLKGRSQRDIVKSVRDRFDVSRNKAKFYAVDQIAKLNADITEQQQRACGVEEYVWSTSRDQRVRHRHQELEGTIHRWDDPPIVDRKTGRRAHPGKDYRCRCVALPVFNLENVSIPWVVNAKKEK